MFERMNYVELSGVKYPIRCNFAALERIQDEYGDLTEFENKLRGFVQETDADGNTLYDEEGNQKGHYGMPNVKTLMFALCEFVHEGIETEKAAGNETPEEPLPDALARLVDVPVFELRGIVHGEFMECFRSKNPSGAEEVKDK